jgi:hypothetical protein
MKISFLLLLVMWFLGAINIKATEKKYLPVYIALTDTSLLSRELLLNIKGAFAMKKIKTISKAETLELIELEAKRIMIPYFENLKTSSESVNYEDIKRYKAANQENVANSLIINLKVDAGGLINDTVKWDNHTVPINMLDFPKTKWHYMILDSTNARTLLQMTQSIVDSIIASNVLVRD